MSRALNRSACPRPARTGGSLRYAKLAKAALALVLGVVCLARAAVAFVIEDIRVEGLQRISAGTVFTYLPIGVGADLKENQYPEVVRALFKTGFFTDVSLARDGNVLVIVVSERPSIAEINIEGNADIGDDDLTASLRNVGFAEGRVFDRALLDRVEQELVRQYFSRGKYAVRIASEIRPLPRNRVAIDLAISEGVAARIKRINFVGNIAYDDDDLLDEFQLSTSGLLTLLTKNDQYSKQKLEADIEALRSFYLDRGFLRFNIESTQVSITPDKKDIYITINVTEGDRYTLRDIGLSGNLVVAEEALKELITVQAGDEFSRSAIADSVEQIGSRVGNEGYAFARVNPVPRIDEASKQVDLDFVVEPGRRIYVRRINFSGNLKTQDEVLRREMRQMEGAVFAKDKVDRSRTRLQRLEYLEQVELATQPVVDGDGQVDLDFQVTERPAGSVVFGIGYGQESELTLNASVSQKNFLGTGNEVEARFNNSSTDTIYSFSYNNPYYTLDGISRGIRLSYSETDAGENNTADYLLDGLTGVLQYGFPVNETDTFRAGIGYDGLRIRTTNDSPQEISDFLEQNGERYDNFVLRSSFARDTRNRSIFADRGSLNRLSAEIALPGSDTEYYKLDFRHQSFYGLLDDLTFAFRTTVGYGDGYGDSDELPFFENYFAGGLRTVRGFKANTLGPRYDSNNEPSGGSFRLAGSGEMIFPAPFLTDDTNVRLSAFVDAGNVFTTAGDFDSSDLRYSVGTSIQWLSPFGPLVLSYAQPLNDEDDDDTENFQFSFGVPF